MDRSAYITQVLESLLVDTQAPSSRQVFDRIALMLGLTRRQVDVAWLANERASDVCAEFAIGSETYKTHWQSIHSKLGTNLTTARRLILFCVWCSLKSAEVDSLLLSGVYPERLRLPWMYFQGLRTWCFPKSWVTGTRTHISIIRFLAFQFVRAAVPSWSQ